jgi:hypothetical protein
VSKVMTDVSISAAGLVTRPSDDSRHATMSIKQRTTLTPWRQYLSCQGI